MVVACLVLLYCWGINLVRSVPSVEIEALHSLYNATNGENWAWDTEEGATWEFREGCDPCVEQWYGIKCLDNETIVEVDLWSMQLRGTIPDNIALLRNTTMLGLGNNFLTSTLPSSLGTMTLMEGLNLIYNYITGTIPVSLQNLTKLEYLSLESNELTGTVPASLSHLAEMKTFSIRLNDLSGSVPPGLLVAMTALETFNIASNSFTGTLPLFHAQANLQKVALQENLFTGTVPSSYFLHTNLIALEMSVNALTGPLPSTFCNATSILLISLAQNLLSGPLPHCDFVNFGMNVAMFGRNYFTGVLSSDIVSLPALELLTVDANLLTSTLPSLANMSVQCNYLNFGDNMFSGSLPYRQSNAFFVAANNVLSGTIPMSYFNSTLSLLDISANILSGSIPNDVYEVNMRVMMLSSNYLTGAIPPPLLNMSNLAIVAIGNNALSGTLPPFSSQGIIKSFIGSSNFLHGSIPHMESSQELENLNLANNLFTGSVPNDLSGGNLYYLSLNSNFMDGTLPLMVFNSWVLEFIDCSHNLLSGTLPSSIYSAYALLNLNLHGNLLSGTLPTRYGPNLVALMYSENKFTGTLPTSLASMSILTVLKVQENHLSGALDDVFSPNHVELLSVDLSDNHFTGSLPTQLFELPRIQSVALVKNCFHGEIPNAICTSDSLQILALDGLASGCKRHLWDPLSIFGDSYITDDTFGSIPACVWDMPALTTLHLSGNGLTGNIESATLRESSNLTSLSLSHNRLTGTIPGSIVDMLLHFSEFDISHNRFAGVINDVGEPSVRTNVLLSLEVNRFSGYVSSKFNSFESVKVLSGNLFQCSKQNDLPSRDPDSDVYICGSGELDSAMYSLAAAFVLMLICLLYCIYLTQSGSSLFDWLYVRIMNPPLAMVNSVCEYYGAKVEDVLQTKFVSGAMTYSISGAIDQSDVSNVPIFNGTLRHILSVAMYISLAILCVVLPCIVILKHIHDDSKSKIQTHQYGWEISAAYMSGKVAALTLTLIWVILVGMCVALIYSRHLSLREATGGKTTTETIYVAFLRKINPGAVFDYGSVVLLNMIVVFIVNGAYIYIQLKDVSQAVQIFSQVSLAGFKLVWDTFAVGAAISWISSRRKDNLDDRTLLYTALLVFNNIIAPCFVTAVTDDTCFKGLFEEAETISVEYVNTKCSQYAIEPDTLTPYCSMYTNIVFETSYQPTFNYNYQCSSAILKSFIPVFIYAYAFMIFALPVMDVMICSLSVDRVPQFIRRNLAGVMWPSVAPDLDKPLIRVDRVISTLMRHLAVLLTFGFAYPLLGVGVVIAMVQYVWKWRLLIVRYVATISVVSRVGSSGTVCSGDAPPVSDGAIREGADVDALMRKLNSDCKGSWRGAYICLWAVIWPGALFVGCLVFDILGDEVGWKDAIWILSSVLLFPLICRFSLKCWLLSVSRDVDDACILDTTASPVVIGATSSSIYDEL